MENNKKTSKHLQVSDTIRQWIQDGRFQPGDQLPTEIELAEEFQVSRHTIRQAISSLTAAGLVTRVQGRGTFVAQPHVSRDTQPTRMIGVLTTYINDYIFPHIIRGIEQELSQAGYSVLLFSTSNDFSRERDALRRILDAQVDGLIVEPTKSALANPNLDLYLQILERNIPMVMLHASYLELCTPTIRIDDVGAAQELTTHLLDLGHRRIGGLFKSDDIQGKFRMRGFLKALKAKGVLPTSRFIAMYETETRHQAIRSFAERIASQPPDVRPEAVVCYNDEVAFELLTSLAEHRIRVPEDLSVVGFDDAPLASVGEVPLTTMTHPKSEMGVLAAQFVIEAVQNPGNQVTAVGRDYVLTSKLVVRKSVRELDDACSSSMLHHAT
ncbi:MAG: GntR family transcriptional regulator [Alicyclobacillus herbarius]|uniref:GntR family transcriptional regulator n=1 Tax=Alicyclobacillus herbarius TaxID=122960 RepID=UPI002352CDF5|nr:GntR family transcriptional regulator [Alicyclobacillus herbarius]MCL6633896.1 GntR family transcriptional regulator [Alicyclobacillus herbarius]